MKFKVGDWVRYTFPGHEKIIKIVEYNLEEFNEEYDNKLIQKWKPQPGEWCWYYNELVNVIGFDEDNDLHIQRTFNDENEILKKHKQVYIEPFIGELPSFIKE